MKIYTKKGDAGETGLFGNARVPKDDLRIQAYGTFDELNSFIGLALSRATLNKRLPEMLKTSLTRIQSELFQLGAELATPRGKSPGIQLVDEISIMTLEKEIDMMEADLEPLKTFILPGGSELSAELQVARTVCRRAERELITLNREESLRSLVLQYVNRLSDFLFVAGRFANHNDGCMDIPWIAPKS